MLYTLSLSKSELRLERGGERMIVADHTETGISLLIDKIEV